MRESKSKSRKTRDNSDGNNASLQMELELTAVKAKNLDLVRIHTKLLQENSELRNEICSLQTDLVNLQGKYNNLEFVQKNLEQNMKKCTPNLIDVLNLFLQVSDSRKNSFNMLNKTNSETGFTPKTKAVTHTVKPHTVNGTVLNLVPTISLTRLNTTCTDQRLHEVSSSSPRIDYRNSLPSTSANENIEANQNENLNPNLDISEVENQSFVSRRKNTTSMPDSHLNGSLDLAEEDIETGDQYSEESCQEEEDVSYNLRRLSPIEEESICSIGKKRTSLGEVRIYLSRLQTEELQCRRSQNTSFTSTDANVSDTCLNIETTVIENPENPVSKRLRADIMVFSPHTNSTRMESDNSMFDDLSPMSNGRKISVSAVSVIQSTEVTPSTSIPNDTDELSPNKLTWLPTPSMSALGDIDTSTTKLDILKESNNKIDTIEHSPVPTPVTPQRYTRSSKKIQTRNHSKGDDESPRSSVENEDRKKSVKNFVGRCSNNSLLTPTIILERLENVLPESETTASSVNIQFVAQSDEPKENENPPMTRETKLKKNSKAKTKSKSPKKSIKRKLKEEEQETGNLQEKIREIRIRLSNYIPETTEETIEFIEETHQRPKRAARPTSYKDPSLKGKLRRMF